jgi:RHS repeat-associated protein
MHYLPYGDEGWTAGGAQPTDFTFTGQRADAYIKLVEMGARWYDPQIGRWISPDPIIPDPANPQSLNRYSYVYNRPLVYIDEEGHIPVIPVLLVLGGAALLCTASNPLPPEQRPPDWQGLLGLTSLFGGGAVAVAPELVGTGATAACADGNCTNEAETVAKALCADGNCTNEVQTAGKALNTACADGDCVNEVQQLGKLRSAGQSVWESTAGLRYGSDPRFGNRVQHIMRHTIDDLERRGEHGVFSGGRSEALATIDEAWTIIQGGGSGVQMVERGARTVYTVDMGRQIGYVGGQVGSASGNPAAQHLRLVIEEANNVITAYPVIP